MDDLLELLETTQGWVNFIAFLNVADRRFSLGMNDEQLVILDVDAEDVIIREPFKGLRIESYPLISRGLRNLHAHGKIVSNLEINTWGDNVSVSAHVLCTTFISKGV